LLDSSAGRKEQVLPIHDRRIGAPVVTLCECGEVAVKRRDPVGVVGNVSERGDGWTDLALKVDASLCSGITDLGDDDDYVQRVDQ
jgi:hypothetical protein